VDKDDDLENEVGIQMNKFNLKGVEESAEEITGWEHKSPLKEGLRYHYFSSDRESPHPLPTAIGEWHKGGGGELVSYQFVDLLLVDRGGFEHL
jgi:hypothetical protein